MPNNLKSKLFSFLFVVDWGTTNDAVELLHEEAPIPTFKHSESTVIKTVCQCLGWLLLELNNKLFFAFRKVFALIKLIMVRLSKVSAINIW